VKNLKNNPYKKILSTVVGAIKTQTTETFHRLQGQRDGTKKKEGGNQSPFQQLIDGESPLTKRKKTLPVGECRGCWMFQG